jgi:hypothetical protein
MHHIKVAFDFFFGAEDLTALWTHVLSCSGLRGASAFNRLTYSIISPSKKKEKYHKLLCAHQYVTHLFTLLRALFLHGLVRGLVGHPPFAPPFLPASLTDILPFSASSFRLLDQHVASIFGAWFLEHNRLARMNDS